MSNVIFRNSYMSSILIIMIIQGISSTIILNKSNFDEGVCQGEQIHIRVLVGCEMSNASVLIDNGNTISSCFNNSDHVKCINASYSKTVKILQGPLLIDYQQHIGKKLVTEIKCRNGKIVNDTVLMIPCRSGFLKSGTRNDTHVTLSCEHSSYKLSTNGMKIQNMTNNDILAQCIWNNTTQTSDCAPNPEIPVSGLENGTRCTLQYKPDMTFRCEMDAQFVEIDIVVEHFSDTGGQGKNLVTSLLLALTILFLVLKFYI